MRYPGGQGCDGALQGDAVDRTGEDGVAAAEVALGRILLGGVDGLLEGDEVEAFLAELHEDEVDGEAMQPGGKGGLSAEAADLAEEVQERLLGHVFGLGDVAEHAQAEGVDAALVQRVQPGEGLGVTVLGGLDGFGLPGDGRVALE
jgi:hypothetical protein